MLVLTILTLPVALPLGPPPSGNYVNPESRHIFAYNANLGTLTDTNILSNNEDHYAGRGCGTVYELSNEMPASVSCRFYSEAVWPCHYLPTDDWKAGANQLDITDGGTFQCAAASVENPNNFEYRVDSQIVLATDDVRFKVSVWFHGGQNPGWDVWRDDTCSAASVAGSFVILCPGYGAIPNPTLNTNFQSGLTHEFSTRACVRTQIFTDGY